MGDPRYGKRRVRLDPLDRACDELWAKIFALIPTHRYLYDLGELRTPEENRQYARVCEEMDRMRSLSHRYREVMRDDAWARYFEAEAEKKR